MPLTIRFFIFAIVGIAFIVSMRNRRSTSLRLAVLNRWTRWLSIALGSAYLMYDFNWFDRPYWVLALVSFLGWLLLETVYTWIYISALSKSAFSLFPRFVENDSGEEWPTQKKLIELKDWLRSRGFKRTQALLADIGSGVNLRSTVFQNEEGTVRFQILFIPQNNGVIGFCFSFSTENQDGERIITDNLYMPYGGFYPTSWNVVRKPWSRSASRLYRIHKERIDKQALRVYDQIPLDELNEQQRMLEKTNLEEGFLVPYHLQEEMGRITWEGRYRVWKEVWLLNYFGVTSN